MAQYTKVFADPYPNGWKAKPDLTTPYLTTIHDNEDATFRAIEDYLYSNPIPDIASTSIGDLSDVDLTGIQNGNVIKWDGTAEKFLPGEGGGGGGTSYSTTEKEIGTDESGNTLYSKTLVYNYPDQFVSANSTQSFQIISTAHEIKHIEGLVEFYPGQSSDTGRYITWPIPYMNPSSASYYKCFYQIYKNTSDVAPYVELMVVALDNYASPPTYKYIKSIRLTAYYTKPTS